MLFADILVGFGAWHVLDSVVSHWMLGIHRVKMDTPDLLMWDLIWFVAFGLVPLVLGWLLRRFHLDKARASGRAAAVGVAVAIGIAGPWATKAPADAKTAVAIFRPGMNDGAIFNAVMASGGTVLGKTQGVWAIRWPEGGRSTALYGRGAVFVSSSLAGAGCLASSTPGAV